MSVNLQSFHVGVDLGKCVNHSAVVVVEQRVVPTAYRDPVTFEYVRERQLVVRMVERVKLGTGYYRIANELERLSHCADFAAGNVTTAFDATGVGNGVEEEFRRKRLRGELYPVVIHSGQQGSYSKGRWPTPRTELLIGVQRAFEVEGLGVAEGVAGWEDLQEELQGMRKVASVRGPYFETSGRHDDLVFGLALALFGARMRQLPVEGSRVRARLGLPG